MQQTLQQQRAKHALDAVQGMKKQVDNKKQESSKLKARTSELPFMIHASGLGQAAAFFKSKQEKDGYDVVFAALQSWLTRPGQIFAGKPDLMAAITQCDMRTYRVAQAEAMQYMDWVKKFASAYLADTVDKGDRT